MGLKKKRLRVMGAHNSQILSHSRTWNIVRILTLTMIDTGLGIGSLFSVKKHRVKNANVSDVCRYAIHVPMTYVPAKGGLRRQLLNDCTSFICCVVRKVHTTFVDLAASDLPCLGTTTS